LLLQYSLKLNLILGEGAEDAAKLIQARFRGYHVRKSLVSKTILFSTLLDS